MLAKSFYKENKPVVALGYERLRNNPDMMSAFQRYIAGDRDKQWIIKYANLSRNDFLTVCNFTDQDWINYKSAKRLERIRPNSNPDCDERTILSDIEFGMWVNPKGLLTYRLYLDMNLLSESDTN
jgi:hypothetical protein